MNNLQDDWVGYYDINFYCSDGVAYVSAYELEISSTGHIQTNTSKWVSFEIPLDIKHDAMLTVFFDSDLNVQHWAEVESDETLADKWQDFDVWGSMDEVMPIITAGMKANDMLAYDLSGWMLALPDYELNDYRKVSA